MSRTSLKRAGAGLGPEYYKLWTATAISTLGDGMYLAALPLLAAQLTSDPLAVSVVTFAAWLPWLLAALASGALVDRWDRRRVLWTADAGRGVLVGTLAVVVLAGWGSIWLLATVGFLLGVGQTLFDSAVLAIIPALVSRDRARLERANGRWGAVMTAGEQLAGPPAGAVAFTAAAWLPFGADAVSFAASAVLLASLRGRFVAEQPEIGSRASLRGEIAEGLGFLLGHRVLRALAGMVGAYSLVFMAGTAILVLFAQQELGLGSVGFGLLLASLAVGALPGSLLAPMVGQRLRAGTVLIGGVLVEAGTWLAVGLAPSAWVAAAALAADGLVGAIWNVAQLSLRQVLIPDRLLGRVIGAFRLVGFGPAPVGALLGGVLGRTLGLRAPLRGRRHRAGAAGGEHPLGGGRPRPGPHPRRRRPGLIAISHGGGQLWVGGANYRPGVTTPTGPVGTTNSGSYASRTSRGPAWNDAEGPPDLSGRYSCRPMALKLGRSKPVALRVWR